MNPDASDLWQRATRAVRTAREFSASDPDAAASRAYYAAFYAVSALFALDGRSFSRHTAVEAAVHRDLVRNGRWPQERGEDYSVLLQTRDTGDYGAGVHVTNEQTADAIERAERILAAVRASSSEFHSPADEQFTP